MSYLTQMLALTVHNFVSAATGVALAIALIRGFARRSAQGSRQFLGRYGALQPLRAAADLHPGGPVLCLAGHAAESQRLCQRRGPGRRQADHCHGTGGVSGSDQDAGHQWRRLLQCQFGASFRKSQCAHQSGPDHLDLQLGRRAHQCVRPHGRQSEAGLGDLCGDGRSVPGRHGGGLLAGSVRQSRLRGPACRPGGEPAAGRRQHGRQGGALWHRQFRTVCRGHDRRVLRRGQHHA